MGDGHYVKLHVKVIATDSINEDEWMVPKRSTIIALFFWERERFNNFLWGLNPISAIFFKHLETKIWKIL